MKTTYNIAVHNAKGRVEALKRVVEAVEGQVDQINIHWNGFEAEQIPQLFFRKPIINSYGVDYSDNGKFAFLPLVKDTEYYFTGDSDIIPPPDYIAATKRAIEKYKCIVTYCGRILNPSDSERYYKGDHQYFSHKQDQHTDVHVDVPGTGVMAFRTDYFIHGSLEVSEYKKMADLVFALAVAKKNKKIICLKHPRTYFKSVYLKGIWNEFNQGRNSSPETRQVELVKKILDEKRR